MKGIRQRGNTIEIYFNWQGKKHFIKVDSLEYATQLRTTITSLIERGELTQDKLNQLINPITFATVVDKYLRYNQSTKQTKTTYENILKHHWFDFYHLPIDSITTEQVLECLIDKELSDKYTNQIMIPLRGVFDTAVMLKYIKDNPITITNRRVQLDMPDPFTKDEVEIILSWLKEYKHINAYLFYKLSFWSGLRPSEVIALTWSDISKDSIYVHKTRQRGIEKNTTKTKTARMVMLNKHSRDAIEQLDGKYYLFNIPNTKRPYNSTEHFRERFNESLLTNNIRNRPSYNTRHTYATMLLMSGVNPSFVANQLGHSLLILTKRYSRWLNSELDKHEMSKLQT